MRTPSDPPPSFHTDRPCLHCAFGVYGYLRFPPGPSMVLPGVSRVLYLVLVLVPNNINVRTTLWRYALASLPLNFTRNQAYLRLLR